MDIIAINNFVWSAISSGVAYDGLKLVLGTFYQKLETYVKSDDKEKFEIALSAVLETNQDILESLNNLKNGETTNITQIHSGTGHNIGRDQTINNNIVIAEKKDKSIEHDKKIFKNSIIILEEQKLYDFLNFLDANHCYRSEDHNEFYSYGHFFQLKNNQFINENIQNAGQQLSKTIMSLINWMSTNFWHYPNNQTERLCMHPDCNMDRSISATYEDRQFYDKKAIEFSSYIQDVKKSYENYRKTIKNTLFI